MKKKMLLGQQQRLNIAFFQILKTSDMLTQSLDSGTGYELMLANDRACTDLRHMRNLRLNMKPCDDDGIFFLGPDDKFLKEVATMGNIVTSSKLTVSDKVIISSHIYKCDTFYIGMFNIRIYHKFLFCHKTD